MTARVPRDQAVHAARTPDAPGRCRQASQRRVAASRRRAPAPAEVRLARAHRAAVARRAATVAGVGGHGVLPVAVRQRDRAALERRQIRAAVATKHTVVVTIRTSKRGHEQVWGHERRPRLLRHVIRQAAIATAGGMARSCFALGRAAGSLGGAPRGASLTFTRMGLTGKLARGTQCARNCSSGGCKAAGRARSAIRRLGCLCVATGLTDSAAGRARGGVATGSAGGA